MNGSEKALSLLLIERAVLEQFQRLDFASGEEYVAGVRRIVEPLQEKIDSGRAMLGDLVVKAATAEDTAELNVINAQAVSVASDLFLSLSSVPVVQELCTAVRDAVAERALELARRELYFSGASCEVPLALLAVGSDGRGEQLLFTDQDFLFLYGSAEGGVSRSEEDIDDYFGMLGSVVVAKLEQAGISRCSGGIMPVNDDWRGSQQQWQERLTARLLFEKSDWEKNILALIALMDARLVSGDGNLGLGFGAMVRSRVRNNPHAIRQMARVVSSMKLSKGFLNRFVVEAEGSHKGEFNMKVLAWMPLVMCVRLLAVNHGIEDTSTLARLRRLRSEGHLPDKLSDELTDAYHTITGHRIRQQQKRLKRVIDDDCYINPYELPTHEREALKMAIGSIENLQNLIRSRFAMITTVDRIITPLR